MLNDSSKLNSKTIVFSGFGERLKEIRNSNSMSMKDLADMLGVSPGQISLYEKEKNYPSIKVLFLLGVHFGVDLSWLVTGTISPLLYKCVEQYYKLTEIVAPYIGEELTRLIHQKTDLSAKIKNMEKIPNPDEADIKRLDSFRADLKKTEGFLKKTIDDLNRIQCDPFGRNTYEVDIKDSIEQEIKRPKEDI